MKAQKTAKGELCELDSNEMHVQSLRLIKSLTLTETTAMDFNT